MKLLNKKWFVWLSLSLNILTLLFFASSYFYFRNNNSQPLAIFDSLNIARQNITGILPIDTNDIVFVGTSLTESFPLYEMFPPFKVKNRGITGNTSKHILGRIESIAAKTPKKIFLEIGINDILFKVPEDTLFNNYKEIVRIINLRSPHTLLFIQSVLPVLSKNQETELSIKKFNTLLKDYCTEEGLIYIDTYSVFNKDTDQQKYFAYDGIHLTAHAYKTWADAIYNFME